MNQLTEFLANNPHIHHATPESSDYEDLRMGFIINASRHPAIIVRPRSAEDVAALVPLLTQNDLPFAVRVGGHDMFGRSQINDGVTIDLREISYVDVDKSAQTARVGGGVVTMDLLEKLHEHDVVTPFGMTPSVGVLGWSTFGGYGLLSPHYGLGVDQIVGAKIVDAQGIICDADEIMLTAIRGGGGCIGVIVELTLKVYPKSQTLAGAIFFESKDLALEVEQFNQAYARAKANGLPAPLHLYQAVINGPGGKSLAVLFMWSSSDMEEGQKWLSRASSWLPVAMSTVQPTTYLDFARFASSMLPPKTYGTIFTINLFDLTPEVLKVIGAHAKKQPNNPEVLLGIHELRANGPTESSSRTVYHNRQPHFLLEILPMASTPELAAEAVAWGEAFRDDLRKTDPSNIVPSSYISLTSPGDSNMESIYGVKYSKLKEIKGLYDPNNVFKSALAQFY
ncbi:(R)-6-hydroxynicotine oxidase [Penicillium ucsense]|uniref:(R)-6-hydroxynicotine oxidase n=1 Tax=Penicillium ucsense TaxID=2839758 RepID=A0A8J8WID1_9EURO|nr:(R)-6-hydroxynicotine oxidase [Penicillium ucsense]KAF7733494.1 (R)-6-hydroxynicotine oxidase [Penicillium ucsense]